MKETRFLPGFHQLFGRAKKSHLDALLELRDRIRKEGAGQLPSVFSEVVEAESLKLGAKHRRRAFDRISTFWVFLAQVFCQGSLRSGLLELQATRARLNKEPLSSSTSAYAQARQRLPIGLLEQIHERVIERTLRMDLSDGPRVLVVDGSSVKLPDTAANQDAYPQPTEQKPGCGFPVMQLVAIFDLNTGVMIEAEQSPWNVHESAMLHCGLLDHIKKGDILLADRGFCSFLTFAETIKRGGNVLMRLHHGRRWPPAGGDDVVVNWARPKSNTRPEHIELEQWESLPEKMQVRYVRIRIAEKGFRTKEIWLVTTLFDASAEELAALYLRRWEMEVCLRDLKTTMGMEMLRCKSPQMAHKELLMYFIAHNLVRWLMMRASRLGSVAVGRLSFKGAVDSLLRYAPVLRQVPLARRRQAIDQMLMNIVEDLLPDRPGRSEPRCVKQRPKSFQLMTSPRHQMVVSASRKLK